MKTPIVGKDNCLDAAKNLALADPEEADANAIFAAIGEHDRLVDGGQESEVVLVAGLFQRGIDGDRKIRSEVADTVELYGPTEGVIVSDGIEGEELVPIIQSLLPIISVRRVIVKHSKSVEESYAVLARYLRMLIFDSRYTRYALGLPGIIFVGLVIISVLDPSAAPLVLVGLIGAVFIIRGFDIDRKIESITSLSTTGYMRLFAAIASVLVILAGIALGFATFYPPGGNPKAIAIAGNITQNPSSFIVNAPQAIGYFIQNSELLIWLGLAIYIAGMLFFNLLRSKPRHVTRDIVALIVLVLLYFPVLYLGLYLINAASATSIRQFVAIVLFALALNFTIAAYIYQRLSRRRAHPEPQAVEA